MIPLLFDWPPSSAGKKDRISVRKPAPSEAGKRAFRTWADSPELAENA
jgi:hypothetical protein